MTEKMDSIKQKIQRINNPVGLFNWARLNFKRLDDTRKSILKLADNPPRRSIAPIHRMCRDIAYRRISFEEAIEKASNYKNYPKMVADQVIPAFYNYFLSNQIETLPDLDGEIFKFPIGKNEDGKTRFIPISPTFIAIRGEKIIPTFILGWTSIPYNHYQKRLISTIIRRAILTRQDFISGDAQVLTFPRAKWSSNQRELGGWMVSQYDDMSDVELQEQFDRYNKAVQQVLAELQSREDA